HYSIYRSEAQVAATRKPSGHALAMAIDAGRFHMSDGRIVTVLEQWTDKTKGADPCAPRLQRSADERMMRELVCNASRDGIFQTVVTPHHNPDHHNHVHLEVSATFAPTWIH
ncbi:MAG TPA: extensin family protein, partial [Polyangiales bacterium]|nr:extensin family protein [Polyangiales bacterium]